MPSIPFGLQLYSVRDYMDKDVQQTLSALHGFGYRHVELAGLHGLSPEAFKAKLDAAGLTPVSAHVMLDEMETNYEQTLFMARLMGIEYLVVPWLGGEGFEEKDAWIDAAQRMDALGAKLRGDGIQLCYHNHSHEFEERERERIFDIIFAYAAPENLMAELDTCWASVAGVDAAALIHRFGKRMPLLHIKDYRHTGETPGHQLTELGRGLMNWAEILEAARQTGVRWYIIEQDESQGDTLESARINAEYLMNPPAPEA